MISFPSSIIAAKILFWEKSSFRSDFQIGWHKFEAFFLWLVILLVHGTFTGANIDLKSRKKHDLKTEVPHLYFIVVYSTSTKTRTYLPAIYRNLSFYLNQSLQTGVGLYLYQVLVLFEVLILLFERTGIRSA